MSTFNVTILTIFPEIFPGPLGTSLAGKGLKNGLWSIKVVNIRNFGLTKHKNVDDKAFGGGDGLIMRADVIAPALDSVLSIYPKAKIYYPSPRGELLTQEIVKGISKKSNIIILCGRFEGIDERIIDEYNVRQISIGDYILGGGEVAAITILDSVVRILPGILYNKETLKEESFEKQVGSLKLIEHPLYTRPAIWRGRKVPKVLLSGNHAKIKDWKTFESIRVTRSRQNSFLK